MTIRVHIERVILEGMPISSAGADIVKIAIERELCRLLAARGVGNIARGANAAARPTTDLRIGATHSDSLALGTQIAASVHSAIGQLTPCRASSREPQP